MLDTRHAWIRIVLLVPLVGCGEQTVGIDRECVRARILEISLHQITRTGRTLSEWAWSIGQIESDGSLTTVMQLDIDLDLLDYDGSIAHDPASGRMWLLATSYNFPAWLFQFDASGQLEWADELSDIGGAVTGGALLHHDGALVLAVGVETTPRNRNLVVQRRDLTGEVVWTRSDIPTPDDGTVLASGRPIGVVGDALAMIVTPPLTDYGPSYPLTLSFASGEPIWSGEDGHDPLAMIVDDERLYLGWTSGPRFDYERLPDEYVELERASSSLQVVTPGGQELVQDQVEWPKGWRRFEDKAIALAWMGDRLISLVEGADALGVTVHDKQGELECQGKLELGPVGHVGLAGWMIGIEGREQALARVAVRTGKLNEWGEHETALRVLLLEPLSE
jgi:hypothetical protein